MTAQLIPAYVDGRLTPVEKLAVHQRGLRHPAISVFVLRGDAVLMQRRALSKYHTPGLWTNTVCTHPHWGEPALDCATRRVDEELGLTGLSLRHAGVVEYRADVQGGLIEHEVVDVFTAEALTGQEAVPNPEEVVEVAWQPMADLLADLSARPDRYTPWLKIYMEKHRQMIFDGVLAV